MNPEDSFEKGFTDAWYGKDKREDYTGDELEAYLEGYEQFLREYAEALW